MNLRVLAIIGMTIMALVSLNFSHYTLYGIFVNQANDCDEICREQNYTQLPDDKEERKRLHSEVKETFGPILKEYVEKIHQSGQFTSTMYGIGTSMRNDGVFETEFEYSNDFYLVHEELEIIHPDLDHPDAGKINVVEQRIFPQFLSFAILVVGISSVVAFKEAKR